MFNDTYRCVSRYAKIGLILSSLAYWGNCARAGEIILLPPKSDAEKNAAEASRQKEKAKSYQKGEPPSLIVLPQEDGVVAPRKSLDASRSSERAREHLQETSPSGAHIPTPSATSDDQTSKKNGSARQARKSHSRAIGYLEGKRPSVATDQDGLPIVDCQATDNVAGRIGEGARSGTVVILVQDRKQIKARCR